MAEKIKIFELEIDVDVLIKDIAKSQKKVKDLKEEIKELTKSEKDNSIEIAEKTVKLKAEQKQLNDTVRQTRNLTSANKEQGLTIEKLKAQNNALVLARERTLLNSKEGRSEFKKLTAEIKKNETQLREWDTQIKRAQRNVGNYPTLTQKVKAATEKTTAAFGKIALGIGAATTTLAAFGSALSYTIDFERQMSKVKALSGATAETMDKLTKSALEFGSTTAFTATQVGELQEELIKLGFTSDEVLNSTGGILDLAAATGTELASSAELAGATLRIFNFDATEMSRVTDVLALSTTKSSLSMEKLATIMPTVGKTAELAGVSLEKTVALSAQLTDRGLDASSAATSLRNIFLELSNKGLTWNEAMIEINGSTDKNKTAMDLFGKRAAAAGVILSETAESTNELTLALEASEGAANSMAETMLDNLAGDLTKAESAWEGFVLSLTEGEGVFSQAARGFTQTFTDLLGGFADLNNESATFFESIQRSGLLGAGAKAQAEAIILNRKVAKKANDEIKQQISENINIIEAEGKAQLDGLLNYSDQFTKESVDNLNLFEETQDVKIDQIEEETEVLNTELNKRSKAYSDYIRNTKQGQDELLKLEIELMEDGTAKLIAEEDFRFSKRVEELEKYENNVKLKNSLLELEQKKHYQNIAQIRDAEIESAFIAEEKADDEETARQVNALLTRAASVREKAREIEDAKVQFEIEEEERRKEIQAETIFGRLEVERQGLDAKEQQEKAYAEKIGASTTLIEKKYSKAREEINKAEQKAKLSLASDFLGNIAQIAGEGTAIGKAAAVAQTTISTYQAATGAYASLAGIPIVGPALGITAAAAAVAAGISNVKKILSVKSGLPEGGAPSPSGISSSATQTSFSGASSQANTTPPEQNVGAQIGQGIVSRDSFSDDTRPISQPVLVTEEVTANQNLTNEIEVNAES